MLTRRELLLRSASGGAALALLHGGCGGRTFLPWARERWACVIFNLHTQHEAAALRKVARDFRRLIDRGIEHGGSYFLTYHRWATREQVLACHPRLPEFLRLKRKYDPEERFQSNWYRHHRAMFDGRG